MSSEQRSSSAVRNLRSLFENKASDSPDSRGRSPGNFGDFDNERPRSKIRASFIPVQPTMAALAAEQKTADSPAQRESSVDSRRKSPSEGHSGEAVDAMKETVSTEQERREQESTVADTIPETTIESATPTPAVEANKSLGEDREAQNPDKAVTGAEEEPGEIRPADPTSESAVSGGDSLPAITEDLKKPASKTASSKATTKPSSISTKPAPRASMSSMKSPSSQPKTPNSTTSPQHVPTKKPSRSSLAAPTAASVARAATADKAAAKASSPSSKPKAREVTKPADISSRLTAPTAASRARLESSSTSAAPAPKPTTTSRPKAAAASARSTPRTSLARPESRSSQTSNKRPAAPVDSSFLERMTRPTAASSNRSSEKVEAKSPPPKTKQLPLRPKPNGVSKAPKDETATAAELPADEEFKSAAVEEDPAPESKDETPAKKSDEPPAATVSKTAETGNETPKPQSNGHQEDAPALESTPASLEEATIR